MEFFDSINRLAARIPEQMDHLLTEEATKNALVLPFINALGYNVFNPAEVVPEFTADVGTKKGEKVDYAIMSEGHPVILMECKTVGSKLDLKHASQLFRYFSTTDARFAILTNGVDYEFYTDIERPNRMDEKHFFTFSILELDKKTAGELYKFSKGNFDLEGILSTASDLKYRGQIESLMEHEMESPSDEFVKHFAKQVHDGVLTASVKQQFSVLVREAFRSFVRDKVSQRLQTALNTEYENGSNQEDEERDMPVKDDSGIVTTEEEVEGYHVVKAICCAKVSSDRVVMRDTKSYCGILLDDNNRKPVCRLHFNRSKIYLGLFDKERVEERLEIESSSGIYQYADRILATLDQYID